MVSKLFALPWLVFQMNGGESGEETLTFFKQRKDIQSAQSTLKGEKVDNGQDITLYCYCIDIVLYICVMQRNAKTQLRWHQG